VLFEANCQVPPILTQKGIKSVAYKCFYMAERERIMSFSVIDKVIICVEDEGDQRKTKKG